MAKVARTRYQLSKFDSSKAKSYSLVAMVMNTVGDTEVIENMNSNGTWNSNFKGAGICKTGSSGFSITIDGVAYLFNSSGNPVDSQIRDYKLVMAEIIENINSSGAAVTGTQYGTTTRGADGSIVDGGVTYETKTIAIENLNARDHFAIEALNSIISKMEQDPTTLGDSTISHYCQQAYKYAAYMMTASANARGIFNDNTETTEDAEKAPIGTLDSTTDKLINNLIVTLERAQNKDEEDNYYQVVDMKGMQDILDKMDAANTALTSLRENVTNAMTNMQAVMTQQLGVFNQIATNLYNINSSIQAFVQALNTNFSTVNNNVQSMKDDINAVGDSVGTLDNRVVTMGGTVSAINTNVGTIGEDVSIIRVNTTPKT